MQPLNAKPDGPIRVAPAGRNRRRYVRLKAYCPAYARIRGNSIYSPVDVNEILDLSEKGMSFQNSYPLQRGRSIKLSLDFPETGCYLRTTGRVVWSASSGRTGIRFKNPGENRRQLQEWLFVNAIAACARQAAAEDKLSASSQPVAPPVEMPTPARQPEEALTAVEYAMILAPLASIRREVEAAGPDLISALQVLAEKAWSFTGAGGAAIALSDGHEMICRARAGPDAPGLGARFQTGSGFSGECVRTGLVLCCDDSEADSRVDRETCRALGIRSMMALPVRFSDRVVGLLEVLSANASAFRVRDKIFLGRMVEMAESAMYRALQSLAEENSLSPPPSPIASSSTPPCAAVESPEFTTLGFEDSGGPILAEEPPPEIPDEAPLSRRTQAFAIGAVAILVIGAVLVVPRIRNRARNSTQTKTQSNLQTTVSPTFSDSSISSFDRLHALAEQGDPMAQYALGVHYATGEDVGQDYAAAAHWVSLAADQGHVVAQATLGAYYYSGLGVQKDFDKAYFWSILARAGGDEASKYRVAAIASNMSHDQILAAEEEADDWLRQHQLVTRNSQTSKD